MSQHNFSLTVDFGWAGTPTPIGTVISESQLNKEIKNSSIARLADFIQADEGTDNVLIQFTPDLTGGEETTLDSVIAAHVPSFPPGPEPVGQGELEILTKLFTFSDTSPVDYGDLVSGDEIVDAELEIITAFDDVAAIVTLGQETDTGNILTSSDVDTTTLATYHSSENFSITGPDNIRVQIVPGTSTQGSGRAIVMVKRA